MTDFNIKARLFSVKYLKRWCAEEEGSKCDARKVIDVLISWMAKLAFFLWLPKTPEIHFGTLIASHVIDYSGNGAEEGFRTFLEALLGEQGPNYFRIYADEGAVWSHPLNIMQNFVPYPPWIYDQKKYKGWPSDDNNFVPRNISGLSKLLFYSTFVKASAEADNISVADVIMRDLDLLPYTRRENFVVR